MFGPGVEDNEIGGDDGSRPRMVALTNSTCAVGGPAELAVHCAVIASARRVTTPRPTATPPEGAPIAARHEPPAPS